MENYICPKCGNTTYDVIENDYVKYIYCAKCEHKDTIIKQAEAPLRCPKCGSTHFSTGARGINGFWGAIGASKTVNRCGNCGHTWEPRR